MQSGGGPRDSCCETDATPGHSQYNCRMGLVHRKRKNGESLWPGKSDLRPNREMESPFQNEKTCTPRIGLEPATTTRNRLPAAVARDSALPVQRMQGMRPTRIIGPTQDRNSRRGCENICHDRAYQVLMRRSSAQRPWLVLIALLAVCFLTLAAAHSHAGHTDTQCWLCAASVGHLGIPAFAGLFVASALTISSVEVCCSGLATVEPVSRLSARAPPTV